MDTMKKRVISLVLALAMCLSLCTTVFAQDSTCEITKESLTPEQLEIYNADMKAFRRTLIDVAMLTIDSVDEDSSFTYQYNISDTLKNLIKIKYTSEMVTLDIYEGDRHDVVNYLPEGIEVDGELFPRETATTRAKAYEYLASPAPGFDSGPYTSDHIVRKNRYDLAKKIADYTTAALCTVLATVFFPGAVSTVVGGVLYSVISTQVGKLVQYAIDHATANCKYISYMENWYIHDDSMPIDKLYKVFVYMYPSLNCTGQAFGPSTYYYHNYFF